MKEMMVGEDAQLFLSGSRRQMLARVADSLYWLSRYVERSEHLARLIHENLQLLTDVGELAGQVKHDLWQGILRIFGVDQVPEARESATMRVKTRADPGPSFTFTIISDCRTAPFVASSRPCGRSEFHGVDSPRRKSSLCNIEAQRCFRDFLPELFARPVS